jgi:hypothetical protein
MPLVGRLHFLRGLDFIALTLVKKKNDEQGTSNF